MRSRRCDELTGLGESARPISSVADLEGFGSEGGGVSFAIVVLANLRFFCYHKTHIFGVCAFVMQTCSSLKKTASSP